MITMRLGCVAACLVALFWGASEAQEVTVSPTAAPSPTPGAMFETSAPTGFLDQLLDNDSLNAAASNLSSGAIGGIVAACVVVALIAGAFYLYKKKQNGTNGPQ